MGGLAKRLVALCACALVACSSRPARRVVSVSPATTRIAKELGLESRLGALDPADPRVLELALATGANLVISDASPESAQVRAAFASRTVPVRVFSPTSTSDVLSAYTEIATVLGKPKAAAQLIDRVTRELEAKASSSGARPTLALVVSRKPLRVVVGDAFLSRLVESAGFANVFAKETGVTLVLRPEQLDARKPDRVLDVPASALARAWVEPVATVEAVTAAAR